MIARNRFGISNLLNHFVVVVLLGWSGIVAAATLEDLRGEWTLLTKLSTESTVSELHVEVNSAGDLAGTVSTMGAEAEITEFAMEGDFALLHFSVARGQQSMALMLKLKVNGDDLSGEVKMGAQGISVPVTGARMGSEGDMLIRMSLAAEAEKSAGKPTLKFSDLGEFAGEWDMTVESESAGTETVPFTLSETSDAMATGLLKLQEPLGEQRINNMTKTDAGLECRYEISAMGQTFKVIMRLALKDGKLEGQIEDEGGIFTIPVHGVRKGQGDSVAGAGASDSQRAALSGRPARQRPGAKTARGTVAGQRFELYYGELETSALGMNKIPFSQTEGYIWTPGKNGATKLKSPATLDFGGKQIPPGRYGLWAKRTKDGWNLIVNEYPDVWSTQHDPEADLAEVPMTISELAAPTEMLVLKIESEGDGGVIRIEFGSHQLSAPFRVIN